MDTTSTTGSTETTPRAADRRAVSEASELRGERLEGIMTPMPRPLSSPVMVGRARELSELEAALARARDGSPGVVLVAGDAGIGKTRLLEQAAEHAGSEGAWVLIGTSAPYAYGPLIAILRELRRQMGDPRLQRLLTGVRRPLARLVPGLEPGDTPGSDEAPAQAPLFEAVLDLVAELGRDTHVLMGMEDLHQADRSTLDLVGFLAANLSTERAMLVATCRTDGAHSERVGNFLAEVVRHPTAQRFDLSPLSDGQVTQLLTTIRQGRPPEETAVRIAKRSQGNPFYVEELLAAGDGDPDLPHGLEDLLLARLAGMSEPTREVLRAAAVLGDRPHDRLLREICGLGDEELRSGLQQAADQGLLVPEGGRSDRYRFRHDLIREVVHRRLLVDQRRRFHAAAARGLEADPDLAAGGSEQVNAELARHWHLAGEPDEAFVASLTAADEATRVHGLSEALVHLQRALSLWDDITEDTRAQAGPQHRLEQRCAELAVLLGDPRTGLEHVRRSLDAPHLPSQTRALLHARAAYFLWQQGRSHDGQTTIDRALDLLPPDLSSDKAETLARAAGLRIFAGRSREALELSQQAIDVATEADAPRSRAIAHNYRGCALVDLGQESDGIQDLREALRIAEEIDDPVEIKRARINLSVVLVRAGRFEQAAETVDDAVGWARERNMGATKVEHILLNGVDVLLRAGRWAEAEARLTSVRSVSRTLVGLDIAESQIRADLRIRQGETDEARELLHRIERELADPADLGPESEAPFLALRAELAVIDGRYDDARQAAQRAARLGQRIMDEQDTVTHSAASYLDPALTHGVRGEVDRALDSDHSTVTRETREHARGFIRLLRTGAQGAPDGTHVSSRLQGALAVAEAELTRLDTDPDPNAWQTAVDAETATGMPYRVAYARFRLAEALLAHGNRDAASDALQQADEVAEELGAEPLRQQIASLARRGRLGLDVAHRDDDLVSDLTPRETDVVELLVEGRTNRQIGEALYITEKTVERHVTSILSKLQVDNRTEAAAVVRRHELLDTPSHP